MLLSFKHRLQSLVAAGDAKLWGCTGPTISGSVGQVLAVFLLIMWISGAAQAQLPVIGLRSLSQSFFAPGGQYEVGIAEGVHTDEVVELVFSHPGFISKVLRDPAKPFAASDTPRYGDFALTLAPETPEGRYEVRAVGRFGISNPRSILVQRELRLVTEVGHDASSATPLTTGVMHCRRVSPQKRDFYSVSVVQGKRYDLRLISQAVDSRMIAAVSVIDGEGRTRHSAIGSDHSDLRFAFTAESSEPLTIAVHDALFRGGPAYQYGLKVTEGVDSLGYGEIQFPKSITIGEATPRVMAEVETPARLEVPALIESDFDSTGDQDQYICELTKNATIVIEVVSDRIGQPTDARVVVDRAIDDASGGRTWQRVATGDDSQSVTDSVIRLATSDPVLRFQPPEDGDYRITVTDLDTGQSLGNVQRYQLSIGPPIRDWRLLAYQVYPHKDAKSTRPTGSHVLRGGSTTIRVFAIRREASQPIKVSIAELPSGLTCHPAWIAANQNQTDLVISASADMKMERVALQVIGVSDAGGQVETRVAKAATVIWEQDGYRPTIHARLVDRVMIATSQSDVAPIGIGSASADVVSITKGTKAKVPMKMERREGGKGNVVLRARNLPPGVKVGDLTFAADKSEAEWTIDVTGSAKPGTYTFWGQGETTVKFAANPQALARATEYRDHLTAQRSDASRAEEHGAIDKAIAEADKQIEAIKKQTNPRDFPIYVPTPLITLEVK